MGKCLVSCATLRPLNVGRRTVLLVAGRDIRILTEDGNLIPQQLKLDPNRSSQPQRSWSCLRLRADSVASVARHRRIGTEKTVGTEGIEPSLWAF